MYRLGKIKTAAESFLNQYKASSPASYSAAQQAVGGLLILDGLTGIDNPLGGNKRGGILGALIGIAGGLFFMFGTGFVGNLSGVNRFTANTAATVVAVNQPVSSTNNSTGGACSAQATYTVDNKEYTQTSSIGTSSACALTAGQTIEITYDPNNPGAWAYEVTIVKTALNVFPIGGAIVTIMSLFTFVVRLLSIIFGWKILKSGRALAKTLPAGTDLSTIKNEISQHFVQQLFGFGGGNAQPITQQTQPQAMAVPTEMNQPPSDMPRQ